MSNVFSISKTTFQKSKLHIEPFADLLADLGLDLGAHPLGLNFLLRRQDGEDLGFDLFFFDDQKPGVSRLSDRQSFDLFGPPLLPGRTGPRT